MGKGFSGVPGNLQNIMKQAQKMQAELQRVQEESELFTAEGSAGGGMVKAVANGKNQIVEISFNPEIVASNDVEILASTTTAAVNDALTKVQLKVKQEMDKVTAGLPMPGLF